MALELQDISKSYRKYPDQTSRIKQLISSPSKKYYSEFKVLREINLKLEEGKCLGLVGRNGSGKSTLLKVIAGILYADSGKVSVRGRVSALLELGIGFNPEFNGIENVRFQCGIMGVQSEEIPTAVERVIEFANLGEYIHQPVKTYSSGMYVRLAFATAIAVEPDVLIIDEALSVGDVSFQNKCLRWIRNFKRRNKTLIFVSHDLNAVRSLCDEAVLLEGGRIMERGNPKDIINYYNNMIAEKDPENATITDQRGGNGKARIKSVVLVDANLSPKDTFSVGDRVAVRVIVEGFEEIESPTIGFSIHDRLGVEIYGNNTYNLKMDTGTLKPGQQLELYFELVLSIGVNTYSISASAHREDSHLVESYDWINDSFSFKVISNPNFCFTGSSLLECKARF